MTERQLAMLCDPVPKNSANLEGGLGELEGGRLQ